MSDTPRTNVAAHEWVAAGLARQLERELAASQARVERLQQELNDAVPVIKFYASHETWWAVALMFDPPCGEIMEDFDIDESDPHQTPRPGKRARDVLRKYAALAEGREATSHE